MSMRRRMLLKQGRLPIGYIELEHIEGTGTQYIDTGVICKSTTNFDITVKGVGGTSSGFCHMFGSGGRSTGSYSCRLFYNTISHILGLNFAGVDAGGIAGTDLSNIATIKKRGVYFYQDDALIYTSPSLSTDGTDSIYISAINTGEGIGWPIVYARWYSVKIYDNDTLQFDGVPCKRESDSEIGMYDLVSQTFYANQGSGTFIAGPVVG